MNKLETNATINVIMLPISAYHGQAITGPATNLFAARRTYVITRMLTIIPSSAWTSLARFKNAPTRNTPSIGPLISEAIDSA
jgi:hypothetical protein